MSAANYAYAYDAGFEEDVAVYSFDTLGDDLGVLLDDQLDDFNDETFGSALQQGASAVGTDFDFAGTTNNYLGAQPPREHVKHSWTPVSAPAPQSSQLSSAWNSLDVDPLLAPPPAPRGPSSLATPLVQQQQHRNMRTLDEVEAEMRAQAAARVQPSARPPIAPAPGQPLTLAQVEADMMAKAKAGRQEAAGLSMPPQIMSSSSQPVSRQQPHIGYSQSPFPANLSAQGAPSVPFSSLSLSNSSLGWPGHPAPLRSLPRDLPPPQHGQATTSAQHLSHDPQQQQRSILGSPASQPPVDLSNAAQTLFPPLPGRVPVASLEQQLENLTQNQHAQHPSFTAAQLQALLAQAHSQVTSDVPPNREGLQGGGGPTAEMAKRLAAEQIIKDVEYRILEHEMLEAKRKRKAAKIASMAQYNNFMSNSDKDFITRIQVSQLITDDPYADDFYFHVMAAIKSSRHNAIMAAGNPTAPASSHRSGAPHGGKLSAQRKPTRRENAMNKMASNVQRLVENAKQRNKTGQLNLDGALGKIAHRTRSAPRQLLQVQSVSSLSLATSAGTALLAGLISQAQSQETTSAVTEQGKPLDQRTVFRILERIYDDVLELEQLRRVQPNLTGFKAHLEEQMASGVSEAGLEEKLAEASHAVEDWNDKYAQLTESLWKNLCVMEPLDICSPHPFIALVSVLKGKRVLPRALRHLTSEQVLTLMILVIATFDTLDTVRDAYVLDATDDAGTMSADNLETKQRRIAVEQKTEAFLNAIIAPFMTVVGQAPLRMVTGMLGLLMQRNAMDKVVRSKPGIAFLTILLTRAESLKQETPPQDAQDLEHWQQTFDNLLNALGGSF